MKNSKVHNCLSSFQPERNLPKNQHTGHKNRAFHDAIIPLLLGPVAQLVEQRIEKNPPALKLQH
jgi:hypothetical protein